jgi:hypothetical protein
LNLFERWVDPATYIAQTRLSLSSAAPQRNLRAGLEAGLELSGRLLTGAAGFTLKLFCIDGQVAAVLGGDKPQVLNVREQDTFLLIDLPDQSKLYMSTSKDNSGILCIRSGLGASTSAVFESDDEQYNLSGFRLAHHKPGFDAILGAENLLREQPESWIATSCPEGMRRLNRIQGAPPTLVFEPNPLPESSDNPLHKADVCHLDAAARTIWEELGLILKR